jgi:hypothetical protein
MNEPHTDDPITRELSPEGAVRRDAMLAGLMDDMRRVHVRRRARRRMVYTTTPATPPIAGQLGGAADPPPQLQASDRLAAIIEFVRTSDGTHQSGAANIVLIDDDQLLDALASINRPTGLVRAGGRVWLTDAVADEAPRTNRSL